MNQNEQYLENYSSETAQGCSAPENVQRPVRQEKNNRPNILARALLGAVGTVVGATLLFGCFVFWVWGLDYLGVISYDGGSDSGRNEFNQDSGGYSEYDDFYDYFEDYFGGNGGMIIPPESGNDPSDSAPQNGTPGIGVTIQEIPELDFAIDDIYTSGIVVVEINPKGALVGKDIQVGDLIVAANGEPCPNIEALDIQLKKVGVGGEMTLTVARYVAGVASTHDITITLVDISELN